MQYLAKIHITSAGRSYQDFLKMEGFKKLSYKDKTQKGMENGKGTFKASRKIEVGGRGSSLLLDTRYLFCFIYSYHILKLSCMCVIINW